MEKEFRNTKFAKGGGLCFECCDYEGMWDDLEDFIRSYTRTLLESFGEELLDVDIKKDKEGNVETEITFACNLRADQRLKAKEIISSLEK